MVAWEGDGGAAAHVVEVPEEIRVAALRDGVDDAVVQSDVGAWRESFSKHQGDAVDEGENQNQRQKHVVSGVLGHQLCSSGISSSFIWGIL